MYLHSKKLKFKYILRNEEGKIEETFEALKGVDLKVNSGDFIAILGHNGSGKSTFAKHINALLLPSSGTLYVNDIDTSDNKRVWDLRKSTGMVFQNPDNQIIASTVEEDVAFGPENLGISPKKIRFYVDEALSTIDMKDYAHHSPNKLSGGQKQRVAIAGILAMHPKCIVLDEPTAMLDPEGRKEVLDTIHYLNKTEGITIILITHYMDEAVDADYIYVMEKGQISIQGTPKDVFKDVPKIKATGLDVPQPTELAYMLRQEGLAISYDILTVDELAKELITLKTKN